MDASTKTEVKPDTSIAIGDRVRAYDFPESIKDFPPADAQASGPDGCYAEGTVVAIGKFPEVQSTCETYKIKVERRFFDGHEVETADFNSFLYPPLNGIPTYPGNRVTHGVIRLPGVAAEQAE